MLRLLLIITVSISIWADTPKLYSSLGDLIYDNMESISRLADIKVMSKHDESIARYIGNCKMAHKHGLALNIDDPDAKAVKNYLEELRALDKERIAFIQISDRLLSKSIEEDDLESYSELIKSGVTDIERDSDRIIDYYLRYRNENYLVEVEELMLYKDELKDREDQEEVDRQSLYKRYHQGRIDQIHKRQLEKKAAMRIAIDAERESAKRELNRELDEELLSTQ